jgi:indole-3-glycerol phosphate synthase
MRDAMSNYTPPAAVQGTILEDIILSRMREVEEAKAKWPAESILGVLDRSPVVRSLRRALSSRAPGVIAEIKRASPSAGLLRADLDAASLAAEYQNNGAAAISVVTEGEHFRGRLEDLARLRWSVGVPLLRKDFIVDPWQLLESRHAGADAILLIVALLDGIRLRGMLAETGRLGMEALVEVHDELELKQALDAGALIVGVNNRDLRTFEVTLETSLRLGKSMPADVVAVAESGIRTRDDVRSLTAAGYRGLLVGETLVRAASPGAALRELAGGPSARKAA